MTSHLYRSEIRRTDRSRKRGIRPWLALRVGSVAAFKRVGTSLLTLCVIGSLAAVADAAAQGRRKHAIKLTIVENQISTTNPNPGGPPPGRDDHGARRGRLANAG